MAQETWLQYVARISKGARNADIARAVKLSESTITRWRDGKLPTPSVAVGVARAYGGPPLEALVAAGYLTPEEVQQHVTVRHVPLSDLSDVDLAVELLNRAEAAADRAREAAAGPSRPLDLATADEQKLLRELEQR